MWVLGKPQTPKLTPIPVLGKSQTPKKTIGDSDLPLTFTSALATNLTFTSALATNLTFTSALAKKTIGDSANYDFQLFSQSTTILPS